MEHVLKQVFDKLSHEKFYGLQAGFFVEKFFHLCKSFRREPYLNLDIMSQYNIIFLNFLIKHKFFFSILYVKKALMFF